MPDEFEQDLGEETQEDLGQGTGTGEGDEGLPPVATPPAAQPYQPSPLEQRLAAAEMQSHLLIQQMARDSQARTNAAPAEPEIPADILAGATPIVNAVLGSKLRELEDLKSELRGFKEQNTATAEKNFILSQVPDFDAVKMDVAAHIHAQLDALGIPPDPAVRREYFNPVAVVTAANFLKQQRGAAQTPNPNLQQRSAIEGRGGGTPPPSTPPQKLDYVGMSDAEFAKHEARISQARMRRNSG